MATIASAREKYARKTAPGGPGEQKWNAKKGMMPGRWSAGLARFGINPGPLAMQSYQAGIAAAQYRGGDAAEWEDGMRRGLSQ